MHTTLEMVCWIALLLMIGILTAGVILLFFMGPSQDHETLPADSDDDHKAGGAF